MRRSGATALTLAALALTVGACGSASDGSSTGESSSTPTRAVGHGSKTRDCDIVLRDELDRVGILGVHPKPSYASVTYVPCPDKPRTAFAAGFELRDKRPFTLHVEIGAGSARELLVSRPVARK